ncbi:gliding motility protein GldM [Flavobacterium sp. Sd200]|uniref:type IX secretion system motor protein PorM/GldM n=1 Tax=Flavobacterium sp. Sd200 TaxID=2692211 RepID=UPI00136883FB|nr:gliding motility protein GldM [Flavobacterium sp. Sd200]MXN90991.1 gliding motility protein GldM [Flavobacterium sp. Sd200]
MAGGKQTPRQKMVNLMYLVFIAMMALNMSKEVLSAFGLMNEQFEASNKEAAINNKGLYDALATKAGEDAHFVEAKNVAEKVQGISAQLVTFLESLKSDITKEVERTEKGKLPYEAMDKGDKIDEGWFAGDGYSKKGQEIVDALGKYKADMKAALGNESKYKSIVKELDSKFDTSDVVDGEGVKKKYLDYHYKGFPAIASLTKLSALQNSVETIEASVYSSALGKAAVDASSMKNYTALVVLDKNAYFQGEKVTGKVVLGKYDADTKPTSFQGPGKIENGQAVINMTAGAVGEQSIKGQFTFLEDGKEVPLKFESTYVVVPRPNSATISADKMNSVYRGVNNPMSISFAGVAASDVTVSAPGIQKGAKPGQYNWTVTSLPGESAVVTVTGKLPDGSTVSDKKTFVIRDIPRPMPSIRGREGSSKGSKEDLSVSTIGVVFPGFVFDVTTTVNSFEVFVPGNPRLLVQGNKFDDSAKKAIAKAKRGDIVTIGNIKVTVAGAGGYRIPDSSNFSWEVQ